MTAVAVCGFGRCGSTMLMAMLNAGGIPPVAGADERSYEAPLERLTASDVDGRAVKVLDFHDRMPAGVDWRIIWCDRRPADRAASAAKLADAQGWKVPPDFEQSLLADDKRKRSEVRRRLAAYGPIHTVRYERALRKPLAVAAELLGFLAVPDLPMLDQRAAAAAVHDRSPAVRPDLDFEAYGRRP